MLNSQGRDYLYLIWKSPSDGQQYVVGELTKNGKYEFEYCKQIDDAIEQGFTLLLPFQNKDVVYQSDELFGVFSSRLPDRKRKDMDKILKKYSMDHFNEYQLLKRSGARLPIDNLYFVDPISISDNEIKRYFFLAGVRHYLGCNGSDCRKTIDVSVGEEIYLECESDNVKDKYAVKLCNSNGEKLGYIPRYHSESISKLINSNRKISCIVKSFDKNKTCNECIKVEMVVSKK